VSDQSISLNKFISNTGVCSRREADRWIEAGRVKINKKTARKGNRVMPGDHVSVDGRKVSNDPEPVYLALNKPPGVVCTTDQNERDNIIDYMNYPIRIFPIGRLDKPSTGLILLTNDGDIVNKILRQENNHEKEYIVSIDRSISKSFIEKMSNGIPILGTVTAKCKVTQLKTNVFRIVLTQGLNRQIRRMCEYLGYKVLSLKRVRIMNIKLDGLQEGEWRDLTEQELRDLRKQL